MAANLVLGQLNFTAARITDATARTMAEPYGLAFASDHGLLVSAVALNRVLYFAGTSAEFTSGQPAVSVFGQPDFNSSSPGTGLNQMSQPRHISTDGDDRLYVAEAWVGRAFVMKRFHTRGRGRSAGLILIARRGRSVGRRTGSILDVNPKEAQGRQQDQADGFHFRGSAMIKRSPKEG